jgi:glutamate-1-semialdehyde 2,1-aminomutase
LEKKEVMEYAQGTFMSSTFWTERSGPVAAIKTLEIMERTKSWKILTDKGNEIQKNWKKIAEANNIKMNILGIPALSTFSLVSDKWLKYKTYITQEMLKKNFLASNAFFVSTKHTTKILNTYFDLLNDIFHNIEKFEKNIGPSIDEKLESEVCHSGFKRLN